MIQKNPILKTRSGLDLNLLFVIGFHYISNGRTPLHISVPTNVGTWLWGSCLDNSRVSWLLGLTVESVKYNLLDSLAKESLDGSKVSEHCSPSPAIALWFGWEIFPNNSFAC